MTASRIRFSQEFKDELCREEINTSKPIKDIGTAYDVGPETLRNWLIKHRGANDVHRVFSLTKRVLEGTYQGSAQLDHLQAYLDEFVFRFNRRSVHKRGLPFFRLLETAVAGSPAPYKDIAANKRRPLLLPIPPSIPHGRPRTLAGRPLERPWRAALSPVITAATWITNMDENEDSDN